jgi:hypothetical protein
VVEKALDHKRQHKGWGAQRVRIELARDAGMQGLALPSRSRLSAFFKARCPECVGAHQPRPKPPIQPESQEVHQVWQLDTQEDIELRDGTIATICNIRDPYGGAMIASQAFSTKTDKHWRKLGWSEVRQVLRSSFSEWCTLPDIVLTDNELVLAGSPDDAFPDHLTLWLVGLAIFHRFIRPHCPTDQPQIERNHRILDGLALYDAALVDLAHLQQSLDQERFLYNHCFPSHASDCQGRPPLVAHPGLLSPRRPYHPDAELALFDLQRVFDFLAAFTFRRRVNTTAQINLGRQRYSVGMKLKREHKLEFVQVRLDPVSAQWIILTDDEALQELLRSAPKGLHVLSLTGLSPSIQVVQPIQLALPFPIP